MAKRKVPKARLVFVRGRTFQMRYLHPTLKNPSGKRKQIRLSTGTDDERVAKRQLADLQRKLNRGDFPEPQRAVKQGDRMTLQHAVDEYKRLKLASARDRAATYKLDVVLRTTKHRFLDEFAKSPNLAKLHAELRVGRADQTAAGYMRTAKAFLNWCSKPMEWIDAPCRYSIEVKAKPKGRPLVGNELQLMLEAVDTVCPRGADEWKRFLKAMYYTGLRLEELWSMTWDQPGTIQPKRSGGHVVIAIPTVQKNNRDEVIATTPEFAALLDEIPEDDRTGEVFHTPRQRGSGRYANHRQVGRVISKIGKQAGIVVERSGKFASAHDLRRTTLQRLADSGIPQDMLQRFARHSDIKTTEQFYIQHDAIRDAAVIAEKVGTQTDDRTHFLETSK